MGGVICVSEVTDISLGNLDSILWFIQPGISHDVFCLEVNLAGWQYTALMYSFPPILNQSVPYPVLIVASWPAHRFLRRQVRWSGIPISWRIFHSLLLSTQAKGFSVVNEAEADIFLEFCCFLHYPMNVGNLISGSSAFSPSLYIWKLLVHVLLKPSLKDFDHLG